MRPGGVAEDVAREDAGPALGPGCCTIGTFMKAAGDAAEKAAGCGRTKIKDGKEEGGGPGKEIAIQVAHKWRPRKSDECSSVYSVASL